MIIKKFFEHIDSDYQFDIIEGNSSWNQRSILFRILPNDKSYDKLKLTWERKSDNYDNRWYIACSKYPEVLGYGNPFGKTGSKENWENEIIKLDDVYNNPKPYQRWIENSENIKKTMSLLTDESKVFIVNYYNKNQPSI